MSAKPGSNRWARNPVLINEIRSCRRQTRVPSLRAAASRVRSAVASRSCFRTALPLRRGLAACRESPSTEATWPAGAACRCLSSSLTVANTRATVLRSSSPARGTGCRRNPESQDGQAVVCYESRLTGTVGNHMSPSRSDFRTDQVLDAVDRTDSVVGSVRRAEVFRVGANFRVAHLFLLNEESEMLLQRLAPTRRRHPLCWGSSVAAYVSAGESYREAIERRARQELGVSLHRVAMLGKTFMEDDKCGKFVSLFSASCSGQIDVDSEHIAEVRFLSKASILKPRKIEPWSFTPTFVHLLDRFHQRIA